MGGLLTTRKKIVDQRENIQNIFNVHDVWRIFCRLDYWFTSDSLYDMVRDVDIVHAIKTDHSAITLQLHRIEDGNNRPGFCKMNTSMWNDTSFIEEMKENIAVWREEAKEISDKRVSRDWIKYNVCLFSTEYSKRSA